MIDFNSFSNQIGALVVVITGVLANSYLKHRKFVRDYGKADYRPAFNPLTALGMIFGWGMQFHWNRRFSVYSQANKEVICLEPTIWGGSIMYTNSIEVIRQIAGGGASLTWIKPEWSSQALLYWGKNMLAANGAEWRRYRRIMQPAFNSKTYQMVWSETTRLYDEMLCSSRGSWPTQSGQCISFSNFLDNTHRLALCVILSCAFGFPLNWDEKAYADEGKTNVSLDEGIKIQGDNLLLMSFSPKWLLNLPFERLKLINAGIDSMRQWFKTTVEKRKQEVAQVLKDTDGDLESEYLRRDVFSRLILASQQGGKLQLEDTEIIGNTWVMFFAGHESTAGVITATLCFLASHTIEQDLVYEEIKSVTTGTAGQLSFDHYESLIKTRSAFVEAMRMIPAASMMVRESTEDTVIVIPSVDADGRAAEERRPIPKGTVLVGDVIGSQYNPRHFPSPEIYKPSRWYNITTEDAYTAFSVGPRSCIGKKFAMVESVAFLSNLLRDYSVEPLLRDGEGLEAWRSRVLGKAQVKLTLSVVESPLRFRRR